VVRITLPAGGEPAAAAARADLLAAEEPLGIRVDGTALTMTMRDRKSTRLNSSHIL